MSKFDSLLSKQKTLYHVLAVLQLLRNHNIQWILSSFQGFSCQHKTNTCNLLPKLNITDIALVLFQKKFIHSTKHFVKRIGIAHIVKLVNNQII